MKKVSKIFCAISAVAVMLMSGVAVSAESEYKLYDEAGLLAEEDAREIETRLEESHTHTVRTLLFIPLMTLRAMRWKATMNGWLPSWTQA